jgi:hypothetical protein
VKVPRLKLYAGHHKKIKKIEIAREGIKKQDLLKRKQNRKMKAEDMKK